MDMEGFFLKNAGLIVFLLKFECAYILLLLTALPAGLNRMDQYPLVDGVREVPPEDIEEREFRDKAEFLCTYGVPGILALIAFTMYVFFKIGINNNDLPIFYAFLFSMAVSLFMSMLGIKWFVRDRRKFLGKIVDMSRRKVFVSRMVIAAILSAIFIFEFTFSITP